MSANLRLVFDNAADRATVTASHEAGSLVAANLQSDERAKVWRGTLTTETLTLSWSVAEVIDSVCLAWTNLTAIATVRVRGYTLPTDVDPVVDMTVSPDSALALGEFVWGVDPLVESGASRARVASQVQVWLAAAYSLRKVTVLITDTENTLGYVEASRIVAGSRIELTVNYDYGAEIGWIEQTRPSRAESRDLRVEPGGRYRELKLDLNWLSQTDRNALLRMVAQGVGRGVWVSGLPEASDSSDAQLYAFWGAVIEQTRFRHQHLNTWHAPVVFEEMA